jgi:hypothetical protein
MNISTFPRRRLNSCSPVAICRTPEQRIEIYIVSYVYRKVHEKNQLIYRVPKRNCSAIDVDLSMVKVQSTKCVYHHGRECLVNLGMSRSVRPVCRMEELIYLKQIDIFLSNAYRLEYHRDGQRRSQSVDPRSTACGLCIRLRLPPLVLGSAYR